MATMILKMKCPICANELQKADPFESICCSDCGYLWTGGGTACSDE